MRPPPCRYTSTLLSPMIKDRKGQWVMQCGNDQALQLTLLGHMLACPGGRSAQRCWPRCRAGRCTGRRRCGAWACACAWTWSSCWSPTAQVRRQLSVLQQDSSIDPAYTGHRMCFYSTVAAKKTIISTYHLLLPCQAGCCCASMGSAPCCGHARTALSGALSQSATSASCGPGAAPTASAPCLPCISTVHH